MAEEEALDTPLIAELYKPPALLPIAQFKDSLLYTIETYPVTIMASHPNHIRQIQQLTKSVQRSAKQEVERRRRFLSFSIEQAGPPMARR
jgi:hypothetical protein